MPDAALDELLSLVELDKPQAELGLDLHGNDPVLPTRFRVGTAGAAAILACALAAAQLWALRMGSSRRQTISVDVRQPRPRCRSARYLRIDGAAPKEPFDPLSGLYQARSESWVFLHCNFPNHRAAALAVLGSPRMRTRDR